MTAIPASLRRLVIQDQAIAANNAVYLGQNSPLPFILITHHFAAGVQQQRIIWHWLAFRVHCVETTDRQFEDQETEKTYPFTGVLQYLSVTGQQDNLRG